MVGVEAEGGEREGEEDRQKSPLTVHKEEKKDVDGEEGILIT